MLYEPAEPHTRERARRRLPARRAGRGRPCRRGRTTAPPGTAGVRRDLCRGRQPGRRRLPECGPVRDRERARRAGRTGHVQPDGRFGIIGFSVGGLVALTLAADPAGLPRPSVVIAHDPAGLDFEAITDLKGRTRGNPRGRRTPASRLLIIESATDCRHAQRRSRDGLEQHLDAARAAQLAASALRRPRRAATGLRPPRRPRGRDLLPSQLPARRDRLVGLLASHRRGARGGIDETAYGFGFCSDTGPTCDPVRDMASWNDGTPAARIAHAADLGG